MTTAREVHEAAEKRLDEVVEAATIGIRLYLQTMRGAQHHAAIELINRTEFVVRCGDGTEIFFKATEI